jgi:hypothetical protein
MLLPFSIKAYPRATTLQERHAGHVWESNPLAKADFRGK